MKANARKEEIIKKLTEIAERRFNGELSERGFIQRMSEELAEEYGGSHHTIKNMYHPIKQKVYSRLEAEAKAKQEVVKEPVKTEEPKPILKQKSETQLISKRKHYIIGDSIDLVIKKITEYGAICATNDAEQQQGLIHISNIANNIIPDVGDYFTEGEIIKNAIIIGKKQEGNLKLSTTHLNLKPKNRNTLLEEKMRNAGIIPKALPHIEKVIENVKSEENIQIVEEPKPKSQAVIMMPVVKPVEPAEHEVKEALIAQMDAQIALEDQEMRKVMEYISKKVGVVSKRAQAEIKEMIEEGGIVDFMIATTETMSDFELDISMVFVNEIKKNKQVYL